MIHFQETKRVIVSLPNGALQENIEYLFQTQRSLRPLLLSLPVRGKVDVFFQHFPEEEGTGKEGKIEQQPVCLSEDKRAASRTRAPGSRRAAHQARQALAAVLAQWVWDAGPGRLFPCHLCETGRRLLWGVLVEHLLGARHYPLGCQTPEQARLSGAALGGGGERPRTRTPTNAQLSHGKGCEGWVGLPWRGWWSGS